MVVRNDLNLGSFPLWQDHTSDLHWVISIVTLVYVGLSKKHVPAQVRERVSERNYLKDQGLVQRRQHLLVVARL